MAEIQVNNLALGYEGDALVENLNFEVNSGEYLCIVGENGSGKSTLMRTLLGLQKPMSGEILFGDGLTSKQIGYLPQQTQVQKDFPASVSEIVLSGFQGSMGIRPFYSPKEKKEAADNIERLGITHLKHRCYRELSGGQQQRVLLARALCATERILLLDEPVSGLDPSAQTEMYKIIRKLNKEGVTIIMISHDIHASLHFASHILHMGTQVFFGTTEEFKDSPLGAHYLLKEKKTLGGNGHICDLDSVQKITLKEEK
ncbi:MAG: metal ABC transporter ATP-binding protein [Lachnospiraceae bacterium]|nr:metal ABC transporter ATP-binding protein [Lachnospiraceae bacterium]